jgi:hypothetical protein
MTDTTATNDLSAALDALERCRINIRAARVDAISASVKLAGARQIRADELEELLADALAFVQRLGFCVLGGYSCGRLTWPAAIFTHCCGKS